MKEVYDVIVIGAGTAGADFAKRMAENGLSVLVADKCKKEELGNRLNVFHIDEELFERFGVPKPQPGDEDYLTLFKKGYALSAYGKHLKTTDYPFLVMRLPAFLKRLTAWAESFGVEYEFETEFTSFSYDGRGKINGAYLKKNDETLHVSARLVADCSGIPAVCRTKLKDGYGVENFVLSPLDQFYVVLRYVILDDPEKDRVSTSVGYPYYKTWIAPALREDGAIIGVGANHSFDYAEKCFERFSKDIELPPYKLDYIEKGSTPYRRPPHSFIADGFVALGDSACITKPFSGEGITAAWVLADIAANVIAPILKGGNYPTREKMWPVNVLYMTTQGADFASLLATLIGAVDCSREENDYEFEHDIVFSDKAMTDMNRKFRNEMSFPDTVKLVFRVIKGVLSKNIKTKTVKELLRALSVAGKLEKHYRAYPESPLGYKPWASRADKLWAKAGSMADKCKL